jgi:hypothetical protein
MRKENAQTGEEPEEADAPTADDDTPDSKEDNDASQSRSMGSDDAPLDKVSHLPLKPPNDRFLEDDWRFRIRWFLKDVLRCAYAHLPAQKRLEIITAADSFWFGTRVPGSRRGFRQDPKIYWETVPLGMDSFFQLGKIALTLVFAALTEASCERVLSKMKDISGDDRGSLGRDTQEHLLRLREANDDEDSDVDQLKHTRAS